MQPFQELTLSSCYSIAKNNPASYSGNEMLWSAWLEMFLLNLWVWLHIIDIVIREHICESKKSYEVFLSFIQHNPPEILPYCKHAKIWGLKWCENNNVPFLLFIYTCQLNVKNFKVGISKFQSAAPKYKAFSIWQRITWHIKLALLDIRLKECWTYGATQCMRW